MIDFPSGPCKKWALLACYAIGRATGILGEQGKKGHLHLNCVSYMYGYRRPQSK